MKKKLLTILLAGVMLITLTACDSKKEDDSTPETTPAVETKYSVFIDYDNGQEMSELSITEGRVLEELETPIKSGYTFVEWKVNGEKYDFTTPITKSIVIKATWKKKTASSNNSTSSSSNTTSSTKPSTSTTPSTTTPSTSTTPSTPSTGNQSTTPTQPTPKITSISGIGSNYAKYDSVCRLDSLNASIETTVSGLRLKYDYKMTKLEKGKIYTFCVATMKVYDSEGIVVSSKDLIIGDLEVGEQGKSSSSTYLNSSDTNFSIKIASYK